MNWTSKRILVTGGASFIGSHLVEALEARGATDILVVDDLSTGKRSNLNSSCSSLTVSDLRGSHTFWQSCNGRDVVFHLAAVHGGRGFIDTFPDRCALNFSIDANVMNVASQHRVPLFVYASSACVYPSLVNALTEDLVGPPYHPDGIYGLAKLAGELSLKAYVEAGSIERAVCCRLFTVYGPRCLPSHAITAMIVRAVAGQDPYTIWGDGIQLRSWTYVDDAVEGMLVAAENAPTGWSAFNVGDETQTRVIDAARKVLGLLNHAPKVIEFVPTAPVGPANRVASSGALRRLGWKPSTLFDDGLARTVDWFTDQYGREQAAAMTNNLMGRRF